MSKGNIIIHGCDNFYIAGLRSIAEQLLADADASENIPVALPEIWVFPHCTLFDVLPLIKQAQLDRPYIIFSNEQIFRIFKNVPRMNIVEFIDARLSCEAITQLLKKHVRPAQRYCQPVWPPKEALTPKRLTQAEKQVIHLIYCGFSLARISKINKLSVKTISLYKLSAMKTLHVKSNQELYLKTCLLHSSHSLFSEQC